RSLVGSQMAASRDDSFVLSVGFTLGYGGNPAEVHVRRIPGEAGAPGELAGTLTGYIYSTGGGFPPVVQFGDTSLWHVPMPLGDDEGMWTGYLDATTGQPVDPLAVFPGPFAGAGGLTSLDIAPDGRWLLWRFHEESFDEPPVQIAIAPVEDPTSAEIVEGADLMGWGPDYVILWPADDNQRTSMAEVWITALPLSGPVHPLDGFSYIINLAEDLLIGVPVDPAPGGPDLRTLLTITPEGDRRTISLPDTVTLLSEYGRFGPGAGGTLIAVEDAPALMDDGRCRHPYGIFAVDR
ncbi:MAG: hypothetical protein GYB64_08500, partial [Chloroflexi bacterium]|nr:hypothetical protein [Chloroflexota bacterium]